MSEAFDLHWNRGWKLYEEEKYEEAISEWREASRLNPENGDILDDIGLALSKLGQPEAAIAEWQEAVRLEPGHKWAHKNLAYVLSAPGYSTEALAAVQDALRFSPASVNLHNFLGYHLLVQANKSGDRAGWEAAGEAFQKSIALEPSYSYARRLFAQTQWMREQKREAIETLKEAITINPDDAEAHVQLSGYQSRAWDFRGMVRTIDMMSKLPESEALNRHYTEINHLWARVQLVFWVSMGFAGVIAGGWVWYRRRG